MHVLGANHVLNGQRDTQQRLVLAGRARFIGGLRLRERILFEHGDIAVNGFVLRVDGVQIRLRKLHGRNLAAVEFVQRVG